MQVIHASDRPVSEAFYSVAGRLLFIQSTNLELRNRIEQLFAGWQLESVSFLQRSPDVRISFSCGGTVPDIPRCLSHFEIADGGKCYTNGADLYLTLGNSVVHLENRSPVNVNVSLRELPGPVDPWLARVASFAVCAALRRYGLFDIHSAGVVEPESEKGVLIIGPSGSGKSTLALQLVACGWPYLSDDELLLNMTDATVKARGFRSFFAVSKDKNDAFKQCFEPEAIMGAKRRGCALPGLLLFISLSGEQNSQLHTLTQAETMTRLIRACPWATYDTSIAGANLGVLSVLARQASGFDLAAGRDLLDPGFANEFLKSFL
ncbi:MAG TPA: hypothetical protein VF088_17240 [Pyrinomonadaceae bacterium]